MIYHCYNLDCPNCHTTTASHIDVVTRLPIVLHICTCEGREKNDGVCWRCEGLKG